MIKYRCVDCRTYGVGVFDITIALRSSLGIEEVRMAGKCRACTDRWLASLSAGPGVIAEFGRMSVE